MKVEVYWNIRTQEYSVRHKGLVVKRGHYFELKDCELVVQQAGRNRVVKTGQKNVHAFIRGELVQNTGSVDSIARYNPKRNTQWLQNTRDVYKSKSVVMTTNSLGKPVVLTDSKKGK